mgnify:CR=1 FL=1
MAVVAPRDRRNPGSGNGRSLNGDGALFCLSYVSTQCRPFPVGELTELLEKAREFNDSQEITGLLLHREDSFFQILEGRESAVRALFENICADERHERIEVVAEGCLLYTSDAADDRT